MIGSKIRELRIKKDLTQVELAEGIMHRGVLIKIEKGLSDPSIEQLQKITKKLGSTIEFFISPEIQTELEFIVCSDKQYKLLEMANRGEYEQIILIYINSNKVKFKEEYGFLYSYLVGISYWNMHDYRLALKFLNLFINRIEKAGSSIKKIYIIEYAESLNLIARINLFDKKTDEVEKYLLRARKSLAYNNKKTHVLYWSVCHNLASHYEDIVEYKKALTVLQEVISDNNIILHKIVTPAAHQTAAVIYMDLGDFYSAKEQLRKAISLYNYTGNVHQASLCKVNLIILMRTVKEYNEAFEFIEATLKESNPADQIYHIFELQKAFVMFNSGKIKDISKILKQLNYGKLRTKDRYNYLFLKGISYHEIKDFQKSIICLKKAKPFFEENKLYLDIIYMNNLLFHMSGKKAYLEESNQLSNLPFNTNFVLDPSELINI